MPFARILRSLALVFWLAVLAAPAQADLSSLRVTEAMSSSGVGGTADWFEVTNYGSSAVSITGWKMDDGSFSSAAAVALSGVSSVGPGESVVFLESAAGAGIAAFRAFWGGSAATASIGYYSGSGISFSSTGDGLVLFDAANAEVTPRVAFGVATGGSSFYYSYDAAGDPTTSPNSNAIVSTVGTIGTQVSFTSADALGNIGSPGTAVNVVPEPSSVILAVLGGGLALAGAARRRLMRAPA
jgi:hypothetical protein